MEVSRGMKKLFILLFILILIISGAYLYKIPLPFQKIVNLGEEDKTSSINVWGNLPNGNDNLYILNDKLQEIFRTFQVTNIAGA